MNEEQKMNVRGRCSVCDSEICGKVGSRVCPNCGAVEKSDQSLPVVPMRPARYPNWPWKPNPWVAPRPRPIRWDGPEIWMKTRAT